jgi:hypothetical protein
MKTLNTLTLATLMALGLGCGYSKSMTPAQPGAVPTITLLNPSSASAGAAVPLEVDGTNFASNAVIKFNNTAQTTTYVSTTKLTTTIPASAVMNAGTVPVTVTNPGTPGGPYGGGTQAETSSAMNFTIN